jgi:hypothetical protein
VNPSEGVVTMKVVAAIGPVTTCGDCYIEIRASYRRDFTAIHHVLAELTAGARVPWRQDDE